MNVAERRQQLMIYLADLPDKKVDELYTEVKKDFKESSFTPTQAHLDILEKRHTDFINGPSKPSAWKEAHERIRNKRKSA